MSFTNTIAENGDNNVLAVINEANLVINKTVNKLVSYIGDIITYSILIKNTGNLPADQVIITDPIANGTVFVLNSLVVSVPYTGNLATGIDLTNSIAPGTNVTITYQLQVTSSPNPNPILNTATAAYAFTIDPVNPVLITAVRISNTVSTIIFANNYSQQVSDLIESVALEQAALAAIINAEGAKIQKVISLQNVSTQELLCINKSVADLLDSISLLESILKKKLSLVSCQIDGDAC